LTEPQLIQALQQRQPAAFQLLVDTYKDRIYNTILGVVQNATDAEDLVQDVFIKVYESIQQFKGESSIGTWMYRIAITKSIDFTRWKNRKKKAAVALSWFGGGAVNVDTDFVHPGVLSENKEQATELFKAVKQLAENQRVAFVLQKVEGLNQKQIAELMKIKEGAVESLLSRAKSNLKKILHEYYSA
jgi:RNA polymerase sigma factor (sigma-70 family)